MSSPFLSEIRIFSFNYAPKGWALCNGQLLPINQNQALFSLLGTTYGGNGQTTFGLPNLQGRVPISFGNGVVLGQVGGTLAETINIQTMAGHNHTMMGDAATAATVASPAPSGTTVLGKSFGTGSPPANFTVSMYSSQGVGAALNPAVMTNTGGGQAHTNQQPYLTLNMSIALQGIFPSQN
jgi:microcystin-dependent protein